MQHCVARARFAGTQCSQWGLSKAIHPTATTRTGVVQEHCSKAQCLLCEAMHMHGIFRDVLQWPCLRKLEGLNQTSEQFK